MKRFKHNLSRTRLQSMNMGFLTPVGIREVLPGDSFQQKTTAFIRVSPLLAPVMHPVHVSIMHFFVPNRLTWDNWEDFITGGDQGDDASVHPYITIPGEGGFTPGTLGDFLGVPTGTAGGTINVNALPFRAYNLIWNEYFRDQQLQAEEVVATSDGADSTTNRDLLRVAWNKDYLTTARPEPQLGADVFLPLTSTAPVTSTGSAPQYSATDNTFTNKQMVAAAGTPDWNAYIDGGGALGAAKPLKFGTTTGLQADLANAAGTLQELRRRFAVLRYEEARNAYGSRYVEYLAHLGVRSSDARLQRPEYLGGGKATIQFSEVLQTAPVADEGTSEDVGVGELKGHGIGGVTSRRYRRFFEEHGWVISLMYVRPKSIYMNGLEAHWTKTSKFDYFQKEFQFVGMQEVLNKEANIALSNPGNPFGYQHRYANYGWNQSYVSGQFRDSVLSNGLNYWHYARGFETGPALNNQFIECVPTDRVYASTANDELYVMVYDSCVARRIVAKAVSPRVI